VPGLEEAEEKTGLGTKGEYPGKGFKTRKGSYVGPKSSLIFPFSFLKIISNPMVTCRSGGAHHHPGVKCFLEFLHKIVP